MMPSCKSPGALLCSAILPVLAIFFFFVLAIGSRASADDTIFKLEFSENGRVTLNAQEVKLGKILKKICKNRKIIQEVSEELRNKPISLHFSSLPIHEAIKRILHGISYAFIYGSNGKIEKIVTFSGSETPSLCAENKSDQASVPESATTSKPFTQIATSPESEPVVPMPPAEVIEAISDDAFVAELPSTLIKKE